MEYPHWLMVAGAVLVVVGFIGLAFHKSYSEPVENNPKQAAPADDPHVSRCRTLYLWHVSHHSLRGSSPGRRD